jgi:proteasome lid subunit RPN8/RPN11
MATEKLEVMGLLLGSWTEDPHTHTHTEVEVRHVVVMSRTDRRKDRVEIGYEDMANTEVLASALTQATGKETRIIGWFHSHPHITVLPSHVDIRTQAQYQQMDGGFLGLIVAVFQNDVKQGQGRVEVTAFQSVVPGGGGGGGGDVMMVVEGGGESGGGGSSTNNNNNNSKIDLIHIDDEVQEVQEMEMMASAYDAAAAAQGGGYVRKGIPISLVGAADAGGEKDTHTHTHKQGNEEGPTTEAMRCVVSLQEVLVQEERYFYEAAARTNHKNNTHTHTHTHTHSLAGRGAKKGGDVHALYNSAVYSKALASLMEESALPLVNTLESILLNLQQEKARVRKATERLLLLRGGGTAVGEEGREGGGGEGGGGGGKKGGGAGEEEMEVEQQQQQPPPPPPPSHSAYSANLLAASRPEILRQAASGVPMQLIMTQRENPVTVTVKREYPSSASFGAWWVYVRDAAGGGEGEGVVKGELVRIVPENGGVVGFVFVTGDGEGKKEVTLRMRGSVEMMELWSKVRPIVGASLLEGE